MRGWVIAGAAVAVLAVGCDTGERIGRLEKQNEELKQQIAKRNVAIDLDLQAKCSKDAKERGLCCLYSCVNAK